MSNRLAQFEDLIAKKAKQYGLDPNLLRAVINQESRGNPGAVSQAGASGLMQLMPGTARELGVKNAFDPEQNIDGGARYLKKQIDKFGLPGGLAAYNAGPGNVEKYKGVPPFKETQNYVNNIMKSLGRAGSALSEISGAPEFDLSNLKNLFLAKQMMDEKRAELEQTPESKLKNLLSTIEEENKKITDIASEKNKFNPRAYTKNILQEQQAAIEAGPKNMDKPMLPQSVSNFISPFLTNAAAPYLPTKETLNFLGANKLANVREGIDQSIGGAVSGLTTPESIGITASLATPAAPYVLAAMTPMAAKSTYDSGVGAYEQFKEGNLKEGTKNLFDAGLGAAMTLGGAKAAYKGIKADYAKMPNWFKDETGAIKIRQDTPPIPEMTQTISMQLDALAGGRTKAVLVTPGAIAPEIPKGMSILETKVGTWIYDPKQLKPYEIKKAVAKNTYGEILGYVEQKGADTPLSVAAIQNGVEAKSALVSPKNLKKQADVLQKQFPEAEVKVAGPQGAMQVIENRIDGIGEERGFVTTVKESPMSPKSLSENVSGTYEPIKNVDTLSKAQELVKADPIKARDNLLSTKQPTAEDFAVGMELIRENNLKGDFTESIRIAEDMARKATTQGQAIQALSMYNRLGPDGILGLAAKTINEANNKLPPAKQKVLENTAKKISEKTGIPIEQAMSQAAKELGLPSLTPEFAAKITEQAKLIEQMPEGRAKAEATAFMLRDIAELVPPSIGRKVSTYQAIAQLLNFKTGIRNVLGNAAFAVAENIKDLPAVALDKAVSLFTGERTKTNSGFNQLQTQAKGFVQGLKEGASEAWKGIDINNTGNKFEVSGISNGLPRGRTFKKGVLGGAEKVMNVMLRAPDRAFYQAAKNKSLAEQMSIAKVKEPTAEMFANAEIEALYKTFQDDSAFAYAFTKFKQGMNLGKEFGAGDILLKYPKTPGNILARSLDYSPAGFIKGAVEIVQAARGKGFNQKNFVDSTSRALVGTVGLTALGYKLSELGLLRNQAPRDPDLREVEKSAGLTQSQLNVSGLTRFVLSGFNPKEAALKPNDTLVTYDWAMPLSIPISMGARGQQKGLAVTSDNAKDYLSIAASGLEGGLETIGDQPMIKTFTQLAQGKTLPKSLIEAAKGIPASFTPTILKQFNDLFDNTTRDTKDQNPLKMAANMAINKTPFADKLPAKRNPYGDVIEKYQGGTNSIMNVFFNPSFVSKYKPTPETKMVLDLYKSTSDARIVPIVIEDKFKFNGIPVELNAKQKNNLQEWVGVRVKNYFSQLSNNKEFLTLPDEEKVKVLSNYLTTVRAAGRAGVIQYMISSQPQHLRAAYFAKMVQDNKLSEDQIKNIFKNIAMYQSMSQ